MAPDDPRDHRLPGDLARLRICVWAELAEEGHVLNSGDVAEFHGRPQIGLKLFRWADGVGTVVAELDAGDDEGGHVYEATADTMGLPTGWGPTRDPHLNVAFDNGWDQAGASVEGGAQFQLHVEVGETTQGTAVTFHVSVLWETGKDPSLARNRQGTWSCAGRRSSGWSVPSAACRVSTGTGTTPTAADQPPAGSPVPSRRIPSR